MVPSYPLSESSNASFPIKSKWLVGSSINRKFGCDNISFTKDKRTFSPPDKQSTVLNTSSPLNRKHPSAVRIWVRSNSLKSFHTSSKTVLVEQNCASSWSKYPVSIWCPNKNSPDKGGTWCINVFKKVDFPFPFGPITAIFCPCNTSKLIVHKGCSCSYPIHRSFTSNTRFPPRTLGSNRAWKVFVSTLGSSILSIRSRYLILLCAKAALLFLYRNFSISSSIRWISFCCRA